jgi:tetratricopeptide (TPR) repeat protein
MAAVVQVVGITQAAIHGLGGVGKTQLIVEYAYRHAEDYDVVWWLNAEESASLAADYAALAGQVGLPESQGADQGVAIAAVRRWLERRELRWLLVFDNVAEHAQVIGYVPHSGGHVIFTSRSRQWPRPVRRVEVGVLEQEEASLFLLRRTEQTDELAARALGEELGCLPLALAQAGAFADAVGLSLAEYLERFREHRAALLRRGKPDDYPFTVATTWELSFRAAADQAALAEGLMNLLAFLAPEAIPLDLLTPHFAVLPEPMASAAADPILLDDAVAALRRYSLVDYSSGMLSIHRLVQFVARDRLSERQRQTWALAAVHVIDRAYPSEAHDFRVWPTAARLLSHGLAATAFAEEFAADPAIGRLLNLIGRYLTGRGLYAQALATLDRSLAIREDALGPNHPDFAMTLNDVAVVLTHLGSTASAVARVEQALAIFENALTPDHLDVALGLYNLSTLLREQGDLVRSWQLHERALAIREKALPEGHPDIAQSLGAMAGVMKDQGKLGEARALNEQALEIYEAALGPDHPDVATTLNNLAGVIWLAGDSVGALERFERALRIREAALGPDHPAVAEAISNIAGVLTGQGKDREALSHLDRAMEIARAALGADHPAMAHYFVNYATVLKNQGNVTGARESCERGLRIAQEHATLSTEAEARRLLADLDLQQSRLGPAVNHWRAALRIDQAAGRRREEIADFFGLANAAGLAGLRADRRDLLIVRWLILRDLGDPDADQARRAAAGRASVPAALDRGPG